MFRRLPGTLPPDASFEPDLEKLGFFVTDGDLIRMIKNPEQGFAYRINVNHRVNQVYREANAAAVRKIVHEHLSKLGMKQTRLPAVAADEPHVPIYVSSNLSSASRIILYIGERAVEPGILSWRVIGEEGVNKGSMVNLSAAVMNDNPLPGSDSRPASSTALIVANPCQLLWSYAAGRAVSHGEWQGLPRESIVHEAAQITDKNLISGSKTYADHICTLFDTVVGALVQEVDVKINIVAAEYCATALLKYLDKNWEKYSGNMSSIAIAMPQYKISELMESETPLKPAFVNFISRRARAYLLSDEPVDVPIAGREEFGCNSYSAGEGLDSDALLARCWPNILKWFERVSEGAEEPVGVTVLFRPEAAGKVQGE